MPLLTSILSWSAWATACFVVLVGPWLFGSWEMWWFWPMATLLFLSTGLFATNLIIKATQDPNNDAKYSKKAVIAVLSILPFLIYAFIRTCQADVYMDAERSFLLFLLPILLGSQVAFGFTGHQRKILCLLILIDLLLLGTYGIANHFITHNKYVLFAEGYSQYYRDNRATGSYFCPDHFSGIMELAFCICIGTLLTRRLEWRKKAVPILLSIIAVASVILSKSRGGGISIVAVAFAILIWGFSQWRIGKRWYYRFISLCFIILALLLAAALCREYSDRFISHFGINETKHLPAKEMVTAIGKRLRTTSRGHMISGAIRAWKTSPVFGIGPGMHQNLWPHFSNSMDGDRETGTWPTYRYTERHSYEVHSDWVQLLEEQGIVGFILFLIPFTTIFVLLVKARKDNHAAALAGILAIVCMAVHSLGDFNLQLPATGWFLATIIALPLGALEKRKKKEIA